MADQTFNLFDAQTQTPIVLRLHDNGDGTYSLGTSAAGSSLPSGTPVAGSLAATTSAAALSPTSVSCKGVFIFQAAGNQDTLIGDSVAQTCPIPAVPFFCPVDNVNKLWAKLSANTAAIPWLAIV